MAAGRFEGSRARRPSVDANRGPCLGQPGDRIRFLRPPRVVHGDDLLYRFFLDAVEGDPERYRQLPQQLLTAVGVWMPLMLYAEWPVLLPWVVRDASCRGNPGKGIPDAWSSPNKDGYLRDDNSLVKALPRSLGVVGPKASRIRGRRLGTEFVACHVWRIVHHDDLASRIPRLNSFIPNLVWLPAQVAKLTDREGGVFQLALQAMAWEIYRSAPVSGLLRERVEESWKLIPEPTLVLEPISLTDLNWFDSTPAFVRTRRARLESVLEALKALEDGALLPDRVVTRRYASGLPSVPAPARARLAVFLAGFAAPTARTRRDPDSNR